MTRRDFIDHLLVAGGVLLPLRWSVAQPSIHVGGPMAGGVYYTRENPGLWSGLVDEHLPRLEKSAGPGGSHSIRVTTEHVMNAYDHYIVKHTLLDRKFRVLGQKTFDPRRDRRPVSSYSLLAGYQGPVFALSLCNRHDLWLEGMLV